jgi:hypothetical protein
LAGAPPALKALSEMPLSGGIFVCVSFGVSVESWRTSGAEARTDICAIYGTTEVVP